MAAKGMGAARPSAGSGTVASGQPQRRLAGRRSEFVGRTAEDAAADHFLRSGARLVARRWRGEGGEIDLVLREGGTHVFVEVKRAGTWAAAAARIGPRQVARVMAAALEFLAGDPCGQDAEMRFDVALVDGIGRVEVMRNALAA